MWKKYVHAGSIADALKVMDKQPGQARLIAGGTDLILELERGVRKGIETLVDVSRIPDLDKIVLDEGYRFNLKETDNVCMHSLSSIMPYHIALYNGVDPKKLGLCREGRKAYVQCLDPCEYTGGGTVVFEIEKVSGPESSTR